MKKKSKFLTFILSFFPGLGHIYLGLAARGGFFILAFVISIMILGPLGDSIDGVYFFRPLGAMLMAAIWLASMVDSMVLVDKINKLVKNGEVEGEKMNLDYNELGSQNKKMISMFFSVVPGAGHLYLGLEREGLQLMSLFFLTIYMGNWLNVGLIMVFAPIIWFYSMFDVMHKVSGEKEMKDEDIFIINWLNQKTDVVKNRGKAIGYTLIVIGLILVFDKIAVPMIDGYMGYRMRNFIQTGIVGVLFIVGGIKLAMGNKVKE